MRSLSGNLTHWSPRALKIKENADALNGSRWLAAVALCVVIGACASTRLTNAWRDSNYSGPAFTKILVIGVTKQSSTRRIFEDEFVRQLQTRGIQAVPSYSLIPEDGEVAEDRLAQAVSESGVDGVLITRWVKVDKQTQIYPGSYIAPPYMGFYGFYSSAWIGFYDPPQIYTYDVVTCETNLFDAKTDRLVWSGTTETFSPRDVAKDTKDLAQVIIKALSDNKFI